MKKVILIAAFIILLACKVDSQTTQSFIKYDDKNYILNTNPLELYFDQNPDKKPQNRIVSTRKIRKYTSFFEVKNNILYLNEINAEIEIHKLPNYNYTDKEDLELTWKNIIKEIFPNQTTIKAGWFTGSLPLSKYNNYILLEVNEGIITKELNLTEKEFKKYIKKQQTVK